jgi:hypothetical protein
VLALRWGLLSTDVNMNGHAVTDTIYMENHI